MSPNMDDTPLFSLITKTVALTMNETKCPGWSKVSERHMQSECALAEALIILIIFSPP